MTANNDNGNFQPMQETLKGLRADGQVRNGCPQTSPALVSPPSGIRRPFTLLSEIDPQPVEWLWLGRIPLGELTILDGDPGTNKSSLTLDLAARVTTGQQMPDGSPGMSGGVVLLQAEDSLRKTLPLRAKAAGADMGRIAVLEHILIPGDLSSIEQAVASVQAKLIVVDPLMCFLDANGNKEQATHQALTPLRELAERHNLAVLMVRHLNKSGARHALYRGTGSIAFTAAVRSAFLIGRSPADPNHRVLCQVKSNLGPLCPSLLFEPLAAAGGGVRVEWRGECEYGANALLASPKEDQAARDRAKGYLLRILAKGPVPQKTVEANAIGEDIALRTLERAKAELQIASRRKGFGRGSRVYWELPTTEAPNSPPTLRLADYEVEEEPPAANQFSERLSASQLQDSPATGTTASETQEMSPIGDHPRRRSKQDAGPLNDPTAEMEEAANILNSF